MFVKFGVPRVVITFLNKVQKLCSCLSISYLTVVPYFLCTPDPDEFVSLTLCTPNKIRSLLRQAEVFHQQKGRVKGDGRHGILPPSVVVGHRSLTTLNTWVLLAVQDVSVENPRVRQSGKAYSLSRLYTLITCEPHHVPS